MKLSFRILFFLLLSFWFLLSIYPISQLGEETAAALSPILSFFYSPVCHQQSDKLICLSNYCTLLCARCTGIYFGALLVSAYTLSKFRLSQTSIQYLFYAAIPMLLDVVLSSTGFYEYSHIAAFSTGVIFGCAAFYYFYIGIQDFSIFRQEPK